MRAVIFDIDTLRPDHLGCYGYKRNTSPNIDSVAEEGIRFDEYYCPNAPCLPSRASLVTGQFGIRTGVVGHGGTAADLWLEGFNRHFRSNFADNSLFYLFRRAGMKTASVSTFAERHSSFWFTAGINELINLGLCGGETADMVSDAALKWLDSNVRRDNWMLHVNFWDPHTPYRTPMEYGFPFDGEPLPDDWIDEDEFRKHLMHVGPHGANEIGMWTDAHPENCPRHPGSVNTLAEVKRFIDNYDTGIRFCDDHIGKIISRLKDEGVWDDCAVIITSDHGENLGELGLYAEHGTADRVTCRIPMIVKWPGGRTGSDSSFHTNVDLAPTIADLFGLAPVKGYEYDGISFKPTLTGEGEQKLQDGAVLTQCAHVCQRSAVWGDWLYIRTVHGGYHLFDDLMSESGVGEMLFNIKDDPHERINLAASRPDLCAEGAKRIIDWEERMMSVSRYDRDPMWTVMREGGPEHCRGELEGYIARLRGTPRAGLIPELEKRYARDLKRRP